MYTFGELPYGEMAGAQVKILYISFLGIGFLKYRVILLIPVSVHARFFYTSMGPSKTAKRHMGTS